MKGDERLTEALNSLLADELTAISQYMVHAELCESWGYKKLHNVVEKRAFTEMKHAERLIERILFLEGIPIVSNLRQMHIGKEIPKQLQNDLSAEKMAVENYNKAIKLAWEVGDSATRQILEEILMDEDRHIDEIEELLEQIGQMGLQVFLSTQVGE